MNAVRRILYCFLCFIQSAAALFSLALSCINLAYNIGKPWEWQSISTLVSISVTILCSAVIDSLRDDDMRALLRRMDHSDYIIAPMSNIHHNESIRSVSNAGYRGRPNTESYQMYEFLRPRNTLPELGVLVEEPPGMVSVAVEARDGN